MSEGTPKAIEPKGIVRNATKIGVQDGQAEDLINLRFMDGSWRASGNGRQIENMPTGTIYQQLYVHTNIYHHLLGVAPDPNNGDVPTLWWFAEIDNDGVTFYPLDGTSDRSQWPEEMKDLPTERKALTTVVGDVWITQTGHLLTVIDESDDFEHFVFKTGEDKYIEVNMDVNGKQTDRSLHPFGKVHFNLYKNPDFTINKESENSVSPSSIFPSGQAAYTYNKTALETIASSEIMHSQYITMLAEQTENNRFTHPFLAMLALKLYDGSFVYSSNPVLLNPNERSNKNNELFSYDQIKYGWEASTVDDFFVKSISPSHITGVNEDWEENSFLCIPDVKVVGGVSGGTKTFTFDKLFVGGNTGEEIPTQYDARKNAGHRCLATLGEAVNEPTFSSGGYIKSNQTWETRCKHRMLGYNLVVSLGNEIVTYLSQNSDIIKSLCVFVTPQIEILKLDKENNSSTEKRYGQLKVRYYKSGGTGGGSGSMFFGFVPNVRPTDEILFDLIHQPFYLLREYNENTIQELVTNSIVDLSSPDYKGILKPEILVQQKTLNTETLSRTTYLPKVSYMYNGRLHIANYKSHPFFGYPIDLFHLHNHSVKVESGAWFPADEAGKRVLPNLADNNDEYLQYTKTPIDVQDAETLGDSSALIDAAAPYFLVKVYIDTAQGEQIVTRYIPAYDPRTPVNGRADFIESLNPLITYPDARSKKIRIYYIHYYHDVDVSIEAFSKMILEKKGYHLRYEEFELKPHPYLNIAYYIDPELKPIRLEAFKLYPARRQPTPEEEAEEYVWVYPGLTLEEVQALANMQNTEEYFPNGLKVSKTDQPMFFPVENTYQVGSAQILALMSNTIAVGTGQTGDAPLYVFCKDGVYALYVDSSGQMAYPNARILARDVCNNPRSVTPIDAGVVFTTDRGLMMIAGEQVQEIGAPAEGDVVQFWNAGSVDYSKIAMASMQQIAGLPSELCSTTDFLTYLQDKGTSGKAAIINYNHNMRELMVSNPNYPYSYVLDREGNWSRRDYTAAQYVNNYPTSYRVDADGHFFKVDDEGNANTTLEHRKEADNKIFYLSNVIKLDSIGFKQAYRFVVRGYFESQTVKRSVLLGTFRKPSNLYNSYTLYNVDSNVYNNLEAGDAIRIMHNGTTIQTLDVIDKQTGPNRIILSDDIQGNNGQTYSIYKLGVDIHKPIACVVEGSYDGRKFKPLGYNRKAGKFRDIGCLVSHTDMRFFRICLSGQVTGKTRIDYMEMSAGASMLNTKIR